MLSFEVTAVDGRARRGRLSTPHGVVETPAFMPVATLGAVKGVAPWQLEELGAEILLSNLYHLALRPGIDRIEDLGGIHAFTSWRRPILTDSGGFQVFSLAAHRSIDDGGVTFRSHVDGDPVRLTPAAVVDMQRRMGVDVAMVLDECPPWPAAEAAVATAVDRTSAWARRSREAWEGAPGPGGLFGILQGGVFPAQRERAAAALTGIGFDGYAIGGVSVGEPDAERRRTVEHSAELLPADRPRYLMGVGTPEDILHAARSGVDLFDCVLPARNARHGLLYTRRGPLKIKNSRYRSDGRPPDEQCGCPTCRRVSRALLAHLYRSGEITWQVLATVHNLAFYLDFMADIRKACGSGTLAALAGPASARSTPSGSPGTTAGGASVGSARPLFPVSNRDGSGADASRGEPPASNEMGE
jgi:queuine tRNA-ribosyltransferase